MVSKAEKAPAARPPEAPEPPARPEPVAWRSTRVSKTLWPPQAGTKRLLARHGDHVVCVRYRHDAASRMRYTTVEIVVDRGPVRSPRPAAGAGAEVEVEVDAKAASPGLGLGPQVAEPNEADRHGRQ